MPVVSAPWGYMLVDERGVVIAGPFPTAQEATSAQDKIVMQRAVAPPTASPSGPAPSGVVVKVDDSYYVTKGNGQGEVVGGPFTTSEEAHQHAGWRALATLTKRAPSLLRDTVRAARPGGTASSPFRHMNITPGYRSPDVFDNRDDGPNAEYERKKGLFSDRERMDLGLLPPLPGVSPGPGRNAANDPIYKRHAELRAKLRKDHPEWNLPPEAVEPGTQPERRKP